MARILPVLTPAELALVDQMAELTGSKRTGVIKSALAVYHWFVTVCGEGDLIRTFLLPAQAPLREALLARCPPRA